MFIAQVMKAEGYLKVLNHILCARNYEQRLCAFKVLPFRTALKTVERERAFLIEEQKRYFSSLTELQKFGIKPEEYEEKFRLISSDCLRIGHGSVKPPQWEMA